MDKNVTLNVIADDDDNGTWIEIGDGGDDDAPDSTGHNENLAEILSPSVLDSIAADLLRDIDLDDNSRKEWLQTREQAIGLLGLKVNPPRTSVADGGAAFEGLSTYQDNALLEACVKFQANARGELLPAGGPVKVENDGEQTTENDDQADALEKAVNKFLTVLSPEYVPDHDRGFFQCGWSGLFYVKGYHCPLKRRPVIGTIDAKDLIISAEASDIDTAARVTEIIRMNHSTFVRMQIAGAYIDAKVTAPPEPEKTVVDRKIESIQGIRTTQHEKPDRNDRILYECYADYDIPGHEHKLNGKITGLPIPYKVTIDKASRKILEVRRNWKEDDEQCNKRKTFVVYPFIPAFGFFPLGLMNLMGNPTNGITAAFRVAIDNGMINNFPYWLYAKNGSGQDKTDFRAGPGQGIPVNVPAGARLADMFMPAPTKPLDPAFIQLMQMIKEDTKRIGGVAEIQVGEGKQNAPVGTTIALIEQATKVIDAVHKRLHQAQAEEFRMLHELLQEDPEALWGHGQEPHNADILRAALNNYELTPQADPNVSSHMMRMAKAEAGKQLVLQDPTSWDLQGAISWYCKQIGIPSFADFFTGPPAPPEQAQGPDPNAIKAGSALQIQRMKSNDAAADRQLEIAKMQQGAQNAAADRASKEQEKHLELAKEMAIHPLSASIVDQTAQQMPPQ